MKLWIAALLGARGALRARWGAGTAVGESAGDRPGAAREAYRMRRRLNGQDDAGEAVDLDWYRKTGHLVLKGRLGDHPVIVVITPYTQGRMTLRDVDDTEVLEVLGQPRSTHGPGKTAGRFEVAGITDRGRIRVVYERPARGVVLVITVYPEPE